MDNVTKKNIIDVLKEVYDSVKSKDIKRLKELSNFTVHSASVSQDEDSLSIAILIYSLFKIYGRPDYEKTKSWYFFNKNTLLSLRTARDRLMQDDIEGYSNIIKDYFDSIEQLDKQLRRYIKEIIEQARIKKGTRVYEHGISIGRAAEILGLSKFDLMDYIGKTGIADVNIGKNISYRLDKARGLFK